MKIDGRLAKVIFSFLLSSSSASGFLIVDADYLTFEFIIVPPTTDSTFFTPSSSSLSSPSLFLLSFSHSFYFKNILA